MKSWSCTSSINIEPEYFGNAHSEKNCTNTKDLHKIGENDILPLKEFEISNTSISHKAEPIAYSINRGVWR